MELAKCQRCAKLFAQVRLPVCPTCETAEDKEIFEVSRYLKDHPHSSLEQISDALNIYLEDIFRWIQERRLEVKITAQISFTCASCGVPITSGRMCATCRSQLLEIPSGEPKSGREGAHSVGGVVTGSSSFRGRVENGKYRRE